MSRIGKKPVVVTGGVTITVGADNIITVNCNGYTSWDCNGLFTYTRHKISLLFVEFSDSC